MVTNLIYEGCGSNSEYFKSKTSLYANQNYAADAICFNFLTVSHFSFYLLKFLATNVKLTCSKHQNHTREIYTYLNTIKSSLCSYDRLFAQFGTAR
jgi:hypothetical protein